MSQIVGWHLGHSIMAFSVLAALAHSLFTSLLSRSWLTDRDRRQTDGSVSHGRPLAGLLDVFFTHPRLLAAVRHVLGDDFKMSSSNYHAPLPGWGHQALHADYACGVAAGHYEVSTKYTRLRTSFAVHPSVRAFAV